MTKRTATLLAGALTAALALAGCGDSVAAGGANAATNPASGIWVSNTVGGGNISGHPNPTVPVTLPASRPPASAVPGVARTISALKSAVVGGCWEGSRAGNVYGAYGQLFWWKGQCGTSAFMGAVYQLRPPPTRVARWAPSATMLLPDPVGVETTTWSPESTASRASSWAGYRDRPRPSAQAVKVSNTSSAPGAVARRRLALANSLSDGSGCTLSMFADPALSVPRRHGCAPGAVLA